MNLATKRPGLHATVAFSVMMASQGVWAATPGSYSQNSDASQAEYNRCIPKPYGYDWAHAMCALKYLEREYAILGEQIRAILPTLNRKKRRASILSQRQWEARADRQCDADSHYTGEKYPGTTQIVDYKWCKGFEASLRIEWLEQHYGPALYPQGKGK